MQLDPRFVKLAHDPGDPVLCSHCPFCGSGQITGRSDGGIDCAFCGQSFIVRVQPAFPGMPQAPGMGAPTDIGPDMGAMGPPGMEEEGMPPGEEGEGFPPGEDGEEGPPFGDDEAQEEEGEEGPEEEGGPEEEEGEEEGAPPFPRKKSSLFRTISGDELPEDAYVRHLAILFSGRDPRVLTLVRQAALQVEAGRWMQAQYEGLAHIIGHHPDPEIREKLANTFVQSLRRSSTTGEASDAGGYGVFRPAKFLQAATTENYQRRGQGRYRDPGPKFTRGHYDHMAHVINDMTRDMPASERAGIAGHFIHHLSEFNPRFNRERFIQHVIRGGSTSHPEPSHRRRDPYEYGGPYAAPISLDDEDVRQVRRGDPYNRRDVPGRPWERERAQYGEGDPVSSGYPPFPGEGYEGDIDNPRRPTRADYETTPSEDYSTGFTRRFTDEDRDRPIDPVFGRRGRPKART